MISPPFSYSDPPLASFGEMDAGDFDNTPAPSARPSVARLRNSHGSDPFSSDTAIVGRAASYRHRLLKTSASGPILFETDMSAPPILSRNSPPQLLVDGPEEPRAQHENKPKNVKDDQTPTKSPSLTSLPKDRGVSPDIPASERVCIDPALHVAETHAQVHHPGILKGADFCDAGAATKEILGTNISSPEVDDSSSVETSSPLGHNRMVKVRPAFNYRPMHNIVNHSAGYGSPYGQIPSKVKPFNIVSQLDEATKGKVTSLDGDQNSILADFPKSGVELSFNVPIAKVRPFSNTNENSRTARARINFDAQEKVKPFDREAESSLSVFSQDRPSNQTQVPDDEIPGEQLLDYFPTREHAICADDAYPVEQKPGEHKVEACALTAMEGGVEGHSISQHQEDLDKNGTEIHDMDTCAKTPAQIRIDNNRILRCENCATNTGVRPHSMGSCVRFPDPTHDGMN